MRSAGLGNELIVDSWIGNHGGCHRSCEVPRETRRAAPALLPRSCVRPVVIRLAESATTRAPLRPDSGPTSRTALGGSQTFGSDLPPDAGLGARNVWARLCNQPKPRRNRVGRVMCISRYLISHVESQEQRTSLC
jgi:hypothetical protein